jgi:hypothetical protein
MEVSAIGYRTISTEVIISPDNLLSMDLEMESAPNIQIASFDFNDASGGRIIGNDDGMINIGETPGIFISLFNDQEQDAHKTYAKIRSNSPFVDLITDSLYFGTITSFTEQASLDTLLFSLNPNCPDGEIIDFIMEICDSVSFAWKDSLSFEAHTPTIEIVNVIIHDDSGNQNGVLDNGEQANVELVIENLGRQSISEIISTLTSTDENFSLLSASYEQALLGIQEEVSLIFEVILDQNTPAFTTATMLLDINCKEGYQSQLRINLSNIFGAFYDFEDGAKGWSHASYQTSSNHNDDWQLGEPQGKAGDPASAYSGNNCWGTDLGWELYMGEYWNGEYQNNTFNYLRSPSIDCSSMQDVGLKYMRWLNTSVVDYARILVNDIMVWKSSTRGYSDQGWFEHLIDISAIADGNPDVRITFELETSNSNALGGWNIDDVMIANDLANMNVSSKLIPLDNSNDGLSCFPNPFSNSTSIEYQMEKAGNIDISIYDTFGKKVRSLMSGKQSAGNYSLIWDGTNDQKQYISNGIYLVKMQNSTGSHSKSVILLR